MLDDTEKVALPVGVDGKPYWEAMILGIPNDKFFSLRATFKQELFKQFQGKFVQYKHGNGSVILMSR